MVLVDVNQNIYGLSLNKRNISNQINDTFILMKKDTVKH